MNLRRYEDALAKKFPFEVYLFLSSMQTGLFLLLLLLFWITGV